MTRLVAWVLSGLVLVLTPGRALAADASEDDSAAEATFTLPRHRYAYAAGSVFLLSGLAAGYVAQGDAARAKSVSSASDTRGALNDGQIATATSSLLFIVAGLTLAYGVVLEFLPPSIANKATLTFHF